MQAVGDDQRVAVLVAGLDRYALGRALGGDGVQPKALGRALPHRRALEEVKGAGAADDRLDRVGRQHLGRLHDVLDLAARGPVDAVGEPQHGGGQSDVGLHRRDDLAVRRTILGEQVQYAVARLHERGEAL